MVDQKTVCIVDDDSAALESMAAVVEAMHCTPVMFDSAVAFLDACQTEDPSCLVTDFRMEPLSGLDLIIRLRKEQNGLPVIVVTAYADVPFAVEAMKLGAVTVIEKPCVDEDLVEAIRSVLVDQYSNKNRHVKQQRVADLLSNLSHKEREVMHLILNGLPNKTIASHLDVSLRTVEGRRHDLFRKMGVDCVPTLVRLLVQSGLAEQVYDQESPVLKPSRSSWAR